jgi:hypothetical protein
VVEMNNGAIGIVLKSNPQYESIERPVIKLISSPDSFKAGSIINLSDVPVLSIKRSLDPNELGINTSYYIFNE